MPQKPIPAVAIDALRGSGIAPGAWIKKKISGFAIFVPLSDRHIPVPRLSIASAVVPLILPADS